MIRGVDVQGAREVGSGVFMSTAECRNRQPNETDAQDKVQEKSGVSGPSPRPSPCTSACSSACSPQKFSKPSDTCYIR